MEQLVIPHEEKLYYIQVLKLDGCGYIYIGDSSFSMSNINLVLPTKYESLPALVAISGLMPESPRFLQKLSKKHGMLAFSINCELPASLLPSLESSISLLLST